MAIIVKQKIPDGFCISIHTDGSIQKDGKTYNQSASASAMKKILSNKDGFEFLIEGVGIHEYVDNSTDLIEYVNAIDLNSNNVTLRKDMISLLV